jgi:putative acetyltransferase
MARQLVETGPPEGFSVRHAHDSDAEGVIALYAACWGGYEGMVLDTEDEMAHLNHVATHYEQAGGLAWVAEWTARIVDEVAASWAPGGSSVAGTVAWRPLDDERVELQMLYVMPDARKRGLASYLVGIVETHVRNLGFEMLELWSDVRFKDAHRLYRSLGWEQLDETRFVADLSNSTEFHFLKSLGV